jgi:hypothetical protein
VLAQLPLDQIGHREQIRGFRESDDSFGHD